MKRLWDELYLDCGRIRGIIKRVEKKGVIEGMRREHDQPTLKLQFTQKPSVLKHKFHQISHQLLTHFNITSQHIHIYYKLIKKFPQKNIYQ